MDVILDIIASWSNNWIQKNAQFEEEFNSDDDLRVFLSKMFMVWNENHRLQAWFPIINNEYGDNPSWHFSVESIILVVSGDVAGMLITPHEVNWYVLIPILILLGSSTLTIALSFKLSTDHLDFNVVRRIKNPMSHQILFANYIKFKLLLHSLSPILNLKFQKKQNSTKKT